MEKRSKEKRRRGRGVNREEGERRVRKDNKSKFEGDHERNH